MKSVPSLKGIILLSSTTYLLILSSQLMCKLADLQPALGYQPPSTMTRARGAIAGLGQAGAGKARSKDRAKRCSPRPRKPGLRLSPLRWKTPWGENRGGTPIDVRLPLLEVRPYPSGTAEYHLRLSAFRLRHFFVLSCSSLPGKRREAPSSTKSPGNPCGSHAYEALPPAFCMLQLRMDHRQRRPKDAVLRTAKPGGDGF
jgi:hypothetical protein